MKVTIRQIQTFFAEQFGFGEDDEGYDAQFDLDGTAQLGLAIF